MHVAYDGTAKGPAANKADRGLGWFLADGGSVIIVIFTFTMMS